MSHVKNVRFSNNFTRCKTLLTFSIFDHHRHIGGQNVKIFRYLLQSKIFTQICHLWPPPTCGVAIFQTSDIVLPNARVYSNLSFLTTTDMLRGKIHWRNARFYSNLPFFTCTDICRMSKMSDFQIFLPDARFYSTWPFWPPQTCCVAKCQFFSGIWYNAKFLLKFVIFDHHENVGSQNVRFSDIWYNANFFLKFVIFDKHGHVACQNFRFFIYFCLMQDFTQICHFWPPRTC